MQRSFYPRWLTVAAPLLALLLGVVHGASLLLTGEGGLDSFLFMLLAASLLPYVVCFLLAKLANNIGAALGGLLAVSVLDAAMYWSVFVQPRGSTAALGLLFAPVWKLFVALPVGALIGFAIDAALTKRFLT